VAQAISFKKDGAPRILEVNLQGRGSVVAAAKNVRTTFEPSDTASR
jgi:hypothetical protein